MLQMDLNLQSNLHCPERGGLLHLEAQKKSWRRRSWIAVRRLDQV